MGKGDARVQIHVQADSVEETFKILTEIIAHAKAIGTYRVMIEDVGGTEMAPP